MKLCIFYHCIIVFIDAMKLCVDKHFDQCIALLCSIYWCHEIVYWLCFHQYIIVCIFIMKLCIDNLFDQCIIVLIDIVMKLCWQTYLSLHYCVHWSWNSLLTKQAIRNFITCISFCTAFIICCVGLCLTFDFFLSYSLVSCLLLCNACVFFIIYTLTNRILVD